MVTVSVTVQFEAESMEEANSTVANWTLSPGCTVYAQATAPLEGVPASTDDSGNIVPHEQQEEGPLLLEEDRDGDSA